MLNRLWTDAIRAFKWNVHSRQNKHDNDYYEPQYQKAAAVKPDLFSHTNVRVAPHVARVRHLIIFTFISLFNHTQPSA